MIISAGILFWRKNRHAVEVLLVHPSSDITKSNYGSTWSIPKGNLDNGETPGDAAKREIEEEIGITVGRNSSIQYGGESIYPSGKKKLIYFTHRVYQCSEGHWWDSQDEKGDASGSPFHPSISSWELDGLSWYSVAQALKICHPAVVKAIKDIVFEHAE